MKTFIARQPIFDVQNNVFAYELLFRDGFADVFTNSNPDQASSQIIVDSFFHHDLEKLTNGKIAFINITEDVLIRDYVSLIPNISIGVEILETVEPKLDVIASCKRLKQNGYLIVLDDFVYEKRFEPFLNLADIVKVDFLETSKDDCKFLVEKLSPRGIKLLAEKVETKEVFNEAVNMGYTYFQGYFFSKPQIVTSKVIPGYKLHYLNLLQEIQQTDIDFKNIENIIKRDVSMSYKLLRYINSAFFGLMIKIKSIRHALTLLGQMEIKKWTSLITLAGMGSDKPVELVVQSIIRAKFCEALAPFCGMHKRADDLFLTGLFSLIDAIVDRPLIDMLKDIPIDTDIKEALLGEENPIYDVFSCAVAYERGNWGELSEIIIKLKIDERILPKLYYKSIEWGNQSLQDKYLIE